MRVLVVTSEWPCQRFPYSGIFVFQEVSNLRMAGLDVEVFNFRGSMQPLNYMFAWLRLRYHLMKRKYDIIHAQFGQSGLIVLPSPSPLVVTFRGSDLQGIVNRNEQYTLAGSILRRASRLVASRASEIVVVSEKLRSQLPNRHVHVIPSGIDLDLFKPMAQEIARERLGFSPTKRFALFAADPNDPVKRYELACLAVDRAREKVPSLELLVTHQVPHQQMPLYMNASDVLLLTSFHEGSSNVVKEALACNLPIVSVDVGDVRERINLLDGCLVCSDDSPEQISRALEHILVTNRRTNGRQRILDLSWESTVQKLINVYDKALNCK